MNERTFKDIYWNHKLTFDCKNCANFDPRGTIEIGNPECWSWVIDLKNEYCMANCHKRSRTEYEDAKSITIYEGCKHFKRKE